MIQFNLLPDIKVQYLKARRQKHMVVLASILTVAVSLVIFTILVVTVQVLQKKNLSDLNKDIKARSEELQKTPNLDKILTVQNQLGALTSLHDNKPVATRFFDYISQVTPGKISIAKASINFTESTMTINGTTDQLATAYVYVDTLKFTKFSTESGVKDQNAFTNVVLKSFARDKEKATYTVEFKFDPAIFSGKEAVKLDVPQITTNRSQIAQPDALFQEEGN